VSRWSADSWWYRTARREFLAACPVCWQCSHPGADEIDHVIAASVAPDLRFEPSNWRPSHGHRGCPVCNRKCNQERGASLTLPRITTSRAW
jgi:5-methylcytosine-specific restriction endonuclease McrA